MSEETDYIPDLLTSFRFKLRLTRLIGEYLIASAISVKVDYSTSPEAETNDIIRIWNKIEYWLDSINQAVVINAGSDLAISSMIDETGGPRFSNPLMLLPGEATEEILGYVLLAKLDALGEDVIAFHPIELESVEAEGILMLVTGDYEEVLPGMDEWIGTPNWFTTPWWNRDDGSTLDAKPLPDADLSVLPTWAFNWDFLVEKPKPSGIVITGKFKPKLLED